jgi:hypothetical protein
MFKYCVFLVTGLLSLNAHAFVCFLTMVKDSCWIKYNVTVDVIDASTGKTIETVIVPTNTPWVRQKFTCQPQQKLKYQAQFNPVFWADDKGVIYNAINYLTLPAAVQPQETAWNLNLCFPKQFSEVPFPPEGTGKCICDTSNIPPVPPQ